VGLALGRADALGIDGDPFQPFQCVLPGHSDHTATLGTRIASDAYSCERLPRRLSLAQVLAAQAYADVECRHAKDEPTGAWAGIRLPGSVEVNRWHELLRHLARETERRSLGVELPADLTPTGRKVGEAVFLFLELRDDRWDGQEFTFTRRFCRARAGVSDQQARDGMDELAARGVIEKGPKRGLARTWRLCGVASTACTARHSDAGGSASRTSSIATTTTRQWKSGAGGSSPTIPPSEGSRRGLTEPGVATNSTRQQTDPALNPGGALFGDDWSPA
jgi:hypothetical protein